MSIEIRELIIKTNVVSENKNTADTALSLSPSALQAIKKEVVKACVKQVMEQLEDKQQR